MRFPRTIEAAKQNRHLPYAIRPPTPPSTAERYFHDPLPIRYCAALLVLLIWFFAGGAIVSHF